MYQNILITFLWSRGLALR